MRNLYVAIGLALCSTSALAADFGLGVSARSNDGLLYVPIDISKSFRIEPSIRYASTDASSTDQDDPEFNASQETETLEVGIGVFGVRRITEVAHVYFGGRFAYVDAEITTTSNGSFYDSHNETDQDGYRIGPAVGFEYLFAQHFSVGGEVNYTFLDIDGESKDNSFGTSSPTVETTENKSQGTQTRLIFRYMF